METFSSTYRLQFHRDFTFAQAQALAGYLADLGISHVYASPFFRAAPGSQHGYDVCDHNALNPEVGTRADFDAFVSTLRDHKIGLIVDFVPNHMGIGEGENRWWTDVLENGQSSSYASYFDIDWEPLKRELEGKVLLPVLGDQYGRVLEKGDLRLHYAEGIFSLHYFDKRFPIAPKTTRGILLRAVQLLPDPPAELESIATALEHLPSRVDLDPEKRQERMREKKVIRERLLRLGKESPEVENAIQAALREMQAPEDAQSFDQLDQLLSAQPYRLSSWKVASEEINYRRFFDVNTLAAIRMEEPEVFADAHQLLLELIAAGAVQGVRIDHIDGLANPREYLQLLQTRAAVALGVTVPPGDSAIYLLVEKILAPNERLRTDWPIHGTTGYEFAAQVGGVLVDSAAEEFLTSTYFKFIGLRLDYREIVYRSKRLVMQVSMASEVNALGHLLNRVSESNRWYRDFTVNSLTTAVREVIACFPVYRTYLVPGEAVVEADAKLIKKAISLALRRNPALERTTFEFLRDVLLPPENSLHPLKEELRRSFVLKFQQCTGPITAKGVEDTSFYVYQRLVALNEVGGEPGVFGISVETFHRKNVARGQDFPHSLLATSTHDTKRSEDVRARLAAISEMPRVWAAAVRRWRTINRRFHREIDGESAPDSNEEYLFYQTLLGTWPLEPMDKTQHADYVARLRAYMLKALHEAKVNSSWIEPNQAWDEAVQDFVSAVLRRDTNNRFLPAFLPFAEKIAELGCVNSLSQTILKLTSPGVPDLYQGTEIWDFSLVDPDNRRPVDYAARAEALRAISAKPGCDALLTSWRDGRIKLFLFQTLLGFRRDHPALFAQGTYEALAANGSHAESVIAFLRRFEGSELLIVVPRLSSRVGFPPIGAAWQETTLSFKTARTQWINLFSGETLSIASAVGPSDTGEKVAALSELLREFPGAVFFSEA